MRYKHLDVKDNKASFTVSKEDCSFTGWGYKNNVKDYLADGLVLQY